MKNNSAKTCINQIPALHKKIDWVFAQMNLDIGGGKYDTATKFLNEKGTNNFVYDPYNRSDEDNAKSLSYCDYDSATIANVLNVIETEEERVRVLLLAFEHVRPGGKIYISTYEGDGSGTPSTSSISTHQENRKLKTYLNEVYQVWLPVNVRIKKNMIEVTNETYKSPTKMCPCALKL